MSRLSGTIFKAYNSLLVFSLEMMYYENGNLLQYSGPVPLNTSLLQRATRLSVGSNDGIGGFSTMRMSDLAFWTRELSKQEVKTMYLKSKFLKTFNS